MAKSEKSQHLQSLIQSVKDQWKGTFRKFPDLTVLVLQDDTVCAAIEKRFGLGAGISNVRQLDYDFYTGLHHLVFEFGPSPANLAAASNAFMVIADSYGKLIALVDPFDPVQPNKFVPPLPQESEQPFVLAQPSSEVTVTDQDMYPVQVRSRSFFNRIGGIGGIGVIDDVEIYTKCAYTTRTPSDYWTDYQNDDCGMPDDTILT